MNNVERFLSRLDAIGLTPEQSIAVVKAGQELTNAMYDDFQSKLDNIKGSREADGPEL